MRLIREYIIPRLVIDIAFFYALLMFVGVVATGLPLTWELLVALVANYLMLVFAFIINDIEDRDEDADTKYTPLRLADNVRLVLGIPAQNKVSGTKRFRNPFAFDIVSVSTGYLVLFFIGLVSILLAVMIGNRAVILVSISNLVVGVFYSLKDVRLKSVPVFDVLSHAYLLAAVQIIYFFFMPGAVLNEFSWIILAFAFLHSISGDLYNEVRDFEEDQQAGITNSSTLLGEKATANLARIIYGMSAIVLIVTTSYSVLTIWGIV